MDTQLQRQPQPCQSPPPNHAHAATENTASTNYAQWFAIPFDNEGGYLSAPWMQPDGNTNGSHSNGFTDGQTLLSLDLNPNDVVAQAHQLPMSGGSNNADAQSMPPPLNPRKRKAPTLRDDDWEPVKERVIELHVTQDIPLDEVMDIVEEEFPGFRAT
jgi:hypothetical protein